MACQDRRQADMVAQEILRATENGNVVVRHLNLASLYSICEFANEFLATEKWLDILINNAGKSRLVIYIYILYLDIVSYYTNLISNLLLGILKSSAPSCVVNVSSLAHVDGNLFLIKA